MSSVLYKSVVKNFGALNVLRSLDLAVPDHKFLALLGPSGCGKTTALRILAGLDMPSAGKVFIGQRQRVALARAIVRDPAAFLMDEPLSNLDARLRLTMRGEIKRLCQRLSATTIYVTHDQVEALTMADFVAVMHGGDLQQMAPPI